MSSVVPPPAGASDLQRAAERLDAVAKADEFGPFGRVGAPVPSSRTASRTTVSAVSSSTWTVDACACLAALASPSDTA